MCFHLKMTRCMFSLHFRSLCVCALLFTVTSLAMKTMNGRVAMKSAALTPTGDDIVLQNGTSSDGDSSSECDTDTGDNAGEDDECPSTLIRTLEHAMAACQNLEGESVAQLQYAMTFAQSLGVIGVNSSFAARISAFEQFSSEIVECAIYDEDELLEAGCRTSSDVEELRTAVTDKLEMLLESARLESLTDKDTAGELVFDYLHANQRERFRKKRVRGYDNVESIDGPYGTKRARFLQQSHSSVLKTCPLNLFYSTSLSVNRVTFGRTVIYDITPYKSDFLEFTFQVGQFIQCEGCMIRKWKDCVGLGSKCELNQAREWLCEECWDVSI